MKKDGLEETDWWRVPLGHQTWIH